MQAALGILEIQSWTAGMVALDAMEKAGTIQLLQAELNDFLGVVLKITGTSSDVRSSISAGTEIAGAMHTRAISDIIDAPSDASKPAWLAPKEFNPILEQDVVHFPHANKDPKSMSDTAPYAIGLIETQGFTAVIEAIDTAAKAANVEVLGKEKLGGGYVTVVIKGDVAAVKAAVAAGSEKVGALGKLIASHVIPRPSAAVISLLPKL